MGRLLDPTICLPYLEEASRLVPYPKTQPTNMAAFSMYNSFSLRVKQGSFECRFLKSLI